MKRVIWVLAVAALLPAALAQVDILRGVVLERESPTPQVSTEELKQLIKEGSVLLLDSRSFPEWAVGHIPGAIVLAAKPGQSASEYVSDIAEVERLTGGDKDAAIVLYCNGPYCGKSRRLSGELAAAGYTNVRRYQLGAPVWRALGNPVVIEPAGIQYVLNDPTAYWVDARDAAEIVVMGGLEDVRNLAYVTAGTVNTAKDGRRVPMHDYNARIVVFGAHGEQAKQVAEELAQGAFHNVAYFKGSFENFQAAVDGAPSHADIGERFVAIFNEQDAAIADEIFAPDFVAHVTGSPTPTLDREGWKAYLAAFRASFPDLRLEVRDMVTDGDTLILRVVLRGTQTGAFQDLPPSGKAVAFDGVAIHRIEDGRVVEHWGVMDLLSLMQQLTADAEATRPQASSATSSTGAMKTDEAEVTR